MQDQPVFGPGRRPVYFERPFGSAKKPKRSGAAIFGVLHDNGNPLLFRDKLPQPRPSPPIAGMVPGSMTIAPVPAAFLFSRFN
jgi:hypothetical protein